MRLRTTTLNWSLVHHERFGDTDIFPTPFEYTAIRDQWSVILPDLAAQDLTTWQTSATRRALTPKSRFGFRTATQLDPLDSLLYAGLVYEIAKDLEQYRDPAAHRRVFSHRIRRASADGQLYDPRWNFDTFKDHLRTKCASQPGWVVVTDVADFYSRIYHHPLENCLRSATARSEHVDALMRLLSQWNFTVSSGLPVGPAASRILAEMALVDVDQILADEQIDFCRFSDDYRLFALTEAEAHEHLAVLASALGESHLTLSERKTDILTTQRFASRHLDGERPGDPSSLAGQVAAILERYGYENDLYSEAELEELPLGMVKELDELDLNRILRDKSDDSRTYDVFIVSLALRRLAQLRDDSLLSLVADNLHQFTPVLPQAINYFQRVTPSAKRPAIGSRLLDQVEHGASGHRDYQRIWLLHLFATDPGWATTPELQALLARTDSVIVRPKLLEVLGTRSLSHWFRQHRRDAQNLNGWELRAFIRGAASMRRDEYLPWLNSLTPRLDRLGQAVARYCKSSR